jgi:hypothetical protein
VWEKIAEASALKKKTKAQQKANTEEKEQTEGERKGGRKAPTEEKEKGGSRRSPRNMEERDDKMQVRLLHHTFLF